MSVVGFLFLILSALALWSALLVVTTDRIVHAALWLVITLGSLAGCYLLLAAEFVAWVQVLIYIGAVVVLLMFALMLTRAPTGAGSATATKNRYAAFVAAAMTTVGLCAVMYAGFAGETIDSDRTRIGTATSIGDAIFHEWVLPFEILSLVLLAALVGAIVLSKRGER